MDDALLSALLQRYEIQFSYVLYWSAWEFSQIVKKNTEAAGSKTDKLTGRFRPTSQNMLGLR